MNALQIRQAIIDGTAPDNLTVKGSLDLSDTGITSLCMNERDYELFFCRTPNGGLHIVAGCRHFTSIDAALAHWGDSDYPNKVWGGKFCAAIKAAGAGVTL